MLIISFLGTDPKTGDILLRILALDKPTTLNFRFHDGCLVASWGEEPVG